MRFLYLAVALFISLFVEAQNPYQLFRPGVTYLYENPYALEHSSELSPHLAIRVDSLGCVDTYYTLHPGGQTPEGEFCYEYVPTFIGSSLCQGTGTTDLISENRDTIWALGEFQLRLEQAAPLGTSWVATQLPAADSLLTVWGRVDSISLGQVLGVVDSIKYINFFAEIGENQLASTPIFPAISISRQYGLVDGFFTHRPATDSLGVRLSGMSAPSLGIVHPTLSSVFSQEVGDEWHVYERSTQFHGMNSWYFQDTESRNYLLEQWYSADGDTLWQVVNREDRYSQSGQDPLTTDSTYATYRDTVVHYLDRLRPLLGDGLAGSLQYNEWSGQMISIVSDLTCESTGIRFNAPLDGAPDRACWGFIFDVMPGDTYLNRYGGPYYNNLGLGGVFVRRLRYFQQADGQACGTPYDFVVHTEDLLPLASELQLYPNPTADILYWTLPADLNASGTVQLLNARGQVLGELGLSAGQWDIRTLPRGLYWLRWQVANGQTQTAPWLKQ